MTDPEFEQHNFDSSIPADFENLTLYQLLVLEQKLLTNLKTNRENINYFELVELFYRNKLYEVQNIVIRIHKELENGC